MYNIVDNGYQKEYPTKPMRLPVPVDDDESDDEDYFNLPDPPKKRSKNTGGSDNTKQAPTVAVNIGEAQTTEEEVTPTTVVEKEKALTTGLHTGSDIGTVSPIMNNNNNNNNIDESYNEDDLIGDDQEEDVTVAEDVTISEEGDVAASLENTSELVVNNLCFADKDNYSEGEAMYQSLVGQNKSKVSKTAMSKQMFNFFCILAGDTVTTNTVDLFTLNNQYAQSFDECMKNICISSEHIEGILKLFPDNKLPIFFMEFVYDKKHAVVKESGKYFQTHKNKLRIYNNDQSAIKINHFGNTVRECCLEVRKDINNNGLINRFWMPNTDIGVKTIPGLKDATGSGMQCHDLLYALRKALWPAFSLKTVQTRVRSQVHRSGVENEVSNEERLKMIDIEMKKEVFNENWWPSFWMAWLYKGKPVINKGLVPSPSLCGGKAEDVFKNKSAEDHVKSLSKHKSTTSSSSTSSSSSSTSSKGGGGSNRNDTKQPIILQFGSNSDRMLEKMDNLIDKYKWIDDNKVNPNERILNLMKKAISVLEKELDII